MQIATGGLAAQHAAFPALQSCNGPCKCCYEIIRNYAASKCEQTKSSLLLSYGLGWKISTSHSSHITSVP